MFNSVPKKLTNASLDAEVQRLLDTALDISSTATHSYSVRSNLDEGYLDVIFSVPVSFKINSELNSQILQILMPSLLSKLTVFPNSGPEYVVDSGYPALRFHFKIGNFDRLVFDSIDDIKSYNGVIGLMSGYSFNTRSLANALYSGKSGTGKTTLVISCLSALVHDGNSGKIAKQGKDISITVIDPKMSLDLFTFSRKYGLNYISPADSDNVNIFLASVKDTLTTEVDEIRRRQRELIKNGEKNKHLYLVVIDEAMSVSSMFAAQSSKSLKEYLSLIDVIMMQARSANCALWISSQTITASGSAPVMSSSARDQANLKVLLDANPNLTDCRYLFPELDDPSSIVVPRAGYLKGIGIASKQPLNIVVPFKAPLIRRLQ